MNRLVKASIRGAAFGALLRLVLVPVLEGLG